MCGLAEMRLGLVSVRVHAREREREREREMRGRFLFPKKNGCSGYLLFWPSPAGGVIQDGVERAFLGPVMVPAQLKGDNLPRWARHPGQAFLLGSNLVAGRGRCPPRRPNS